jgi:hypothetical protein
MVDHEHRQHAAARRCLSEHVDKGDMVDVLNIAAMILVREKLYGEAA